MKSLWNDADAAACGNDHLAMRVYSSQLIGRDDNLVLHGGGNTSVKMTMTDLFRESHEALCVKGSGWDLATIEAGGFAPLRLDALIRLSKLDVLTDSDMVRSMRAALLDPGAPNPSVEAILHAVIPFRYVDHSHADAVVTLTNTADGQQSVRQLYGDRVVIVPYVMPGFELARKVADLAGDIDWNSVEGMVLMGHGLFTFAETARESYERMIGLVTEAEQQIGPRPAQAVPGANAPDLLELARLRGATSRAAGFAMLARADRSDAAIAFSGRDDVADIASRGPLTPDHVIRTKRIPLVVDGEAEEAIDDYVDGYNDYFSAHGNGNLTRLDPAPRWAVRPGSGSVAFGRSPKDVDIVSDIVAHTIGCIEDAERISAWRPLGAAEIFAVEYWELEQAKLKKDPVSAIFRGKVALITGAASGIGKATAEMFIEQGAVVAAIDIDPAVQSSFNGSTAAGIVCDVTDPVAIESAVRETVSRFGGIDVVVSNAGIFTAGATIAEMDEEAWARSMDVNLSSAMLLLRASAPFLALGVDPAVVIVGSKNVPAPGRAAAAYSVAKAGLTQLARVAALELADSGVRVNTVHPNAVFDTGIWTEEVLAGRAVRYGMTVEEYKKSNLLGVEVGSADVARMVAAMAGPLFAKTTGAQVPVDGGTERVV